MTGERITMTRTSLIVGVAALALALAGCSGDSDSSDPDSGIDTAAATPTATVDAPPPVDMSSYAALPAVPSAASATVDCTYTPSGAPSRNVSAPEASGVPAEGRAAVDLETTAGPIGLDLDRAAAPCTTHSFVSLAEQGYFDGTDCHRLVYSPGMQILQCGDPTGTGTGGPGYGFDNEYPTTAFDANAAELAQPAVYPRGTIAMANTGSPGSNGSQFFLVFADTVLPPQYTAFGTISEEGLTTIESIAVYGDDGSMAAGGGAPAMPISIETATVAS